ncbi:THUMP domain-containing protein 1 homolog [Oratosquilla oratoria]|uniref:THUMP domain-containing protein 1 homolog n=1 Tax=Oratosquilla oratoria TaxID=337810 RepID=UPI003F762E63
MGKNSKRRRSYYVTFAKRQRHMRNALAPNMVGFLCTCNDREKECVKEAYHVLNQFADQLYGKGGVDPALKSEEMDVAEGDTDTANKEEQEMIVTEGDSNAENETLGDDNESCKVGNGDENDKKDTSDEEEDIDAALKAEVSTLKKDKTEWRFQQVRCSAINCVFISTKLQDPVAISLAIMNGIIKTQKQLTRRLLRLIPVQSTCKAHTEDIIKCGKAMCKEHFSNKELSHYILFKARNNSSIKRDVIVQGLSQAILEASPNSKADRKMPEIVLCVEVIKDVCCFAFLPDYFNKYCKYNLVELAIRQIKGKTEVVPHQGGGDCNKANSESKDDTKKVPDQGEDGCNETTSESKSIIEEGPDQGGGGCNETNSEDQSNTEKAPGQDAGGSDENDSTIAQQISAKVVPESPQQIPAEVVPESLGSQTSEVTQTKEDDSLELP